MTFTQTATNLHSPDFADTFNARVEELIATVRSFDSNTRESIASCKGDDVTQLVKAALHRAKNDHQLLDAVFEHRLRWIRHDQIMHRDTAVFTEDYNKLAEYEALKPGSDLHLVRDLLRDELGYSGVKLYDILRQVVDTGTLIPMLLNGSITAAEDLDGVLKAAKTLPVRAARRI